MWAKWVRSRPACVRRLAESFNPWTLYRIKSTQQRCTMISFQEAKDGTVTLTVAVTGEYNALLMDRQVFGLSPDDIEETELPDPDEALGTFLCPEQVDENIDALRVLVRPDLWVMDKTGKAVRKS